MREGRILGCEMHPNHVSSFPLQFYSPLTLHSGVLHPIGTFEKSDLAQYPRAVVPNLFGTEDQFNEKQFLENLVKQHTKNIMRYKKDIKMA